MVVYDDESGGAGGKPERMEVGCWVGWHGGIRMEHGLAAVVSELMAGGPGDHSYGWLAEVNAEAEKRTDEHEVDDQVVPGVNVWCKKSRVMAVALRLD